MSLPELLTVDPDSITTMLKDYALLHGVVYFIGKVVRPSRHIVKSEWDRMLHGHKLHGHSGPALKCRRAACARLRTSCQTLPVQEQLLVPDQLVPELSLGPDI